MKIRIIDPQVKLFSENNLQGEPIAELSAGDEIELLGVLKRNGVEWCAVSLPSGHQGLIPGDTKIYHMKRATLRQKSVDVHAQPSADSPVIACYQKNREFYLVDVVKMADGNWVKVRDLAGCEGFIDGKTSITVQAEKLQPNKSVGARNMMVGGLWCVGGILVTAITYSAASSSPGGGSYVVAWGAILFGGIQFLKGLFQVLTAPK